MRFVDIFLFLSSTLNDTCSLKLQNHRRKGARDFRFRVILMPKLGQNILYSHQNRQLSPQSLFSPRLSTKRCHQLKRDGILYIFNLMMYNVSDILNEVITTKQKGFFILE